MQASFDAYENLEQALSLCGEYVTLVSGWSMYPMIRYRRDPVLIRPAASALKPYDVAVYNRGDGYVIHRILEVHPDYYVFRGDNCITEEKIPKALVVGVIVGFWRVSTRGGIGRFIDVGSRMYRIYARIWVALNPIGVLFLQKRIAAPIKWLINKC